VSGVCQKKEKDISRRRWDKQVPKQILRSIKKDIQQQMDWTIKEKPRI